MSTYFLDDEPIPQMLCGQQRVTEPGHHQWLCLNTAHDDDRHYWVVVS